MLVQCTDKELKCLLFHIQENIRKVCGKMIVLTIEECSGSILDLRLKKISLGHDCIVMPRFICHELQIL